MTRRIFAATWDHPRIRGEHRRRRRPAWRRRGSSPHTRGALAKGEAGFVVKRIIPAYAGSTYREIGFETIDMDHPRIRGEHHGLLPTRPHDAGSSPHTRGALAVGFGAQLRDWDHPRIRGEHYARR